MLLRRENDSVLLISQPAHGWVTGQLARHWGNKAFPALTEEVCLAAEQHDIGFMEWEQHPTLDVETGLPHSFLDLAVTTHMQLWTDGILKMLQFGRIPAVLVSMHFTSLARRLGSERTGQDSEIVSLFLRDQTRLQATTMASLRQDSHYAEHAADAQIRADQETLSLLDWMSLQLLLKFGEQRIARELDFRPGAANFQLTPVSPAGDRVRIEPWPFGDSSVQLVCDGRRVNRSYTDEAEMRQAIRRAVPETLAIRLEPA
jgi:hypothetical protein